MLVQNGGFHPGVVGVSRIIDNTRKQNLGLLEANVGTGLFRQFAGHGGGNRFPFVDHAAGECQSARIAPFNDQHLQSSGDGIEARHQRISRLIAAPFPQQSPAPQAGPSQWIEWKTVWIEGNGKIAAGGSRQEFAGDLGDVGGIGPDPYVLTDFWGGEFGWGVSREWS